MALADDLVAAATQAGYDADDYDYGDYEQALKLKRDKPHLDNDYPRYEGMARAAVVATLRTLSEHHDTRLPPVMSSYWTRTELAQMAEEVDRG